MIEREEALTGTLRENYPYTEQMIENGWIPNRIDHLLRNIRNNWGIYQLKPGKVTTKPLKLPHMDINPRLRQGRPKYQRKYRANIDRIQGVVNEITNYLSREILKYKKTRVRTSSANTDHRTRTKLQGLLNQHLNYWHRAAENYGPQWCKPWIYGWSMANYAQLMNMITTLNNHGEQGWSFLKKAWWETAKDRIIQDLSKDLYSSRARNSFQPNEKQDMT